ncbi:MAG: sigma-70 family RNA polymerase sigma factor [Planctomycetes bacterium]|nr:sigma-70 family RNA polymerase sigma factor [Planctomycetota bacterium]
MEREADLRDLVERAQRGDRAAFGDLAAATRDRLLAVTLRILGRGTRGIDPEDVLQETCLRAFRRIGAFVWQGEGSFLRWLGGFAGNVIRELEKEGRRSPLIGIDRDPAGSGVSPSKALRREERLSRLQEALEALSPDHREVIRLARFEGLPLREVARRMGRSLGAVRQLLWRALQALKSSFGDTESLGLPERGLEGAGPPHDRGAP